MGNSNITWCDFDNDNDLDILHIGTNDDNLNEAILYRNLGQDLFEEVNSNLQGVKSGEVCWGDLDNDGSQDLIMVGQKGDEGITRMYRNSGNDNFESISHNFLDFYHGDVDLGDYDNDLDLDVLIIGYYKDDLGGEQKALKLYHNEGDFSFTEISPGFIGMSESNIQWADYDADGDLDILANGSTEAPTHLVYLYKNQGNGNFLNIGIEIYGTQNGTVNWGDYDNDGDLDFLLTGMPSYNTLPITEIYRNIAEDLFNKEDNQNLPGIYNSSTEWCDYDKDGDLDVIMTGQQTESGDFLTAVYKNKNELINQVPSVPENLESEVTGSAVTLLWNSSTDPETQSENLTYNIKLGSSSQAYDILSPMANSDGVRFINHFGNAGYNTSHRLENLSPGQYYWSVQAIDNNFSGSEFSIEETFIISAVNIKDDLTLQNQEIKIFPNPFIADVFIQLLNVREKLEQVSIYSTSGKLVAGINIDYSDEQIWWDGKDKAGKEALPGIYFLNIICDGERTCYKLLKL